MTEFTVKFINAVMREFMFWRYVIPVVWMYVCGRYYVFRDTPTWFIEDIVNWAVEDQMMETEEPNFLQQARDELKLRERVKV